MAEYEDVCGARWPVMITVQTIRDVKKKTGYDLMEFIDGGLFEKLVNRPVDLCAVLEVVTGADEQGTQSQLAQGLGGDAIERAFDALVTALVDFFPRHLRTPLAEAVEKYKTTAAMAGEAAAERIRRMRSDDLLRAAPGI